MQVRRIAWLSTNLMRFHITSHHHSQVRLMSSTSNPLHGTSDRHVHQPRPHIHILGIGNLGLLFAHSLFWQPRQERPPITLLLHRPGLLQDWTNTISLTSGYSDGSVETREGYETELLDNNVQHEASMIENLILTTKTINTISALSSIKHRLTADSTILFAQNGMGTMEEVNEKVFTDPSIRPNYIASVVSHGVYGQGPFRSVHAGMGTISLGRVEGNGRDTSSCEYLMEQVTHAPALAAREVNPVELKRIQLQKLVVNAMINPLTVIFNYQNGALFKDALILSLMQRLLAEASQIIRMLPEIQMDPEKEHHFSYENLEKVVLDMAIMTGKNTSSMLQDVRAGKPTEIDYINGYLVKRAQEVGVDCDTNRRLVEMVKGVQRITPDQIMQCFP